jgi:hypothetical protein
MSLERLIGEHDDIEVLSRSIQILTRQEPPDFEKTSILVAQLARDVTEHLEYEYTTVYAVLIARYATVPSAGADRFKHLFEDLRSSWSGYFDTWNEDHVRADWTGFCHATDEIFPHLQSCARKELNIVYSLALNDGTIKLRKPI